MRIITFFAVFIALLSFSVKAVETDVFNAQYQALELRELEEKTDVKKTDGFRIEENISFAEGIKRLKTRAGEEMGSIFRSGLKTAVLVLVISCLCGISASFNSKVRNFDNYIMLAGALAITVCCTSGIRTVTQMGMSIINTVHNFSKALFPTLTAATVASGAPTSATMQYTTTAMFSDMVISLISKVMIPLVNSYIVLSTAEAAIGENSLGRIASFVKWLVSMGLKVATTAFVTYLGISGIISATGDSAVIRATRIAITGSIPVVGGVIANATESVFAGSMVIKNAIGVFGMLTVLSVCLTPFLTLAVNYFTFKAAAAVIAPVTHSRLTGLVDNIASSYGMIMAMCAVSAIIVFFFILSCMCISGIA